jgi:hypothetical protein
MLQKEAWISNALILPMVYLTTLQLLRQLFIVAKNGVAGD